MDVQVSIITPCYNHGIFLEECIASTRDIVKSGLAEHIIVNDGSTDELTIKKFKELESSHCQIIHQQNAGLAAARNAGIKVAKGEYILPLDADNKIEKTFFEKAVACFENDTTIDIIYGDREFFGDYSLYEKMSGFDFLRTLYLNYIDACAIYKKKVWEEVDGYDGNMPVMGYEDWEFWIDAYFKGFQFHYLPLLSFYYRVRADSMLRTIAKDKEDESRKYIFKKHIENISRVYAENYCAVNAQHDFIKKYLKNNRIKSIAKILLGIEIKL